MTDALTNVVMEATGADRRQMLTGYIVHHAMYHTRELAAWDLPFLHVPFLDYLRLDAVMVPFSALLLILLFAFGYKRNQEVPRGMSNLLEIFVLFIRNQIAVNFLGEQDGRKMTPLFCSFFFFILMMNLLGLVPLFGMATSNINVTGALAAVTLAFMIFGSIYKNGFVGFLKCFVLPGVPLPLQFLLVPIEVFSMLTKAVALMVRLFANMLAGHVVIFSLLGMVFLFGWIAFPAAILAVGVFFFELFVAFFQAYIFTLLSAVFIGQMMHPDHSGET
ncbi:MAG: F0F1 ATP synthase subunit A [Lentisphaerota bacterium]